MNKWFRDSRVVRAELSALLAKREAARGRSRRAARLYRSAEDGFRSTARDVGDDFPNTKRDLEEAAATCQRCAEELEQ